MKTYAGIGSRETPPKILDLMECIASRFARFGWTLRSGRAPGADQAFERGAWNASGTAQIFVPWEKFELESELFQPIIPAGRNLDAAIEIAKQFHPAWDKLTQGAQKLMARNSMQILGPELDAPVSAVVCWTPKASGSGGTGQAIRIAKAHGIVVYDLGDDMTFSQFNRDIQRNPML